MSMRRSGDAFSDSWRSRVSSTDISSSSSSSSQFHGCFSAWYVCLVQDLGYETQLLGSGVQGLKSRAKSLGFFTSSAPPSQSCSPASPATAGLKQEGAFRSWASAEADPLEVERRRRGAGGAPPRGKNSGSPRRGRQRRPTLLREPSPWLLRLPTHPPVVGPVHCSHLRQPRRPGERSLG